MIAGFLISWYYRQRQAVLSHRTDVNVRNNRSQTPLEIAVKRGHNETIELLRKDGAEE
jgi:ankyrin repeat protein